MIAFDSNILIYIGGLVRNDQDIAKIAAMQTMLANLSGKMQLFAAVQVLGEVYHVCQRKGFGRQKSRELVQILQDHFTIVDTRHESLIAAMDLATEHNLQIWDALIVNAAADAGCTLLLSEDMQDSFQWRGVTIVNPFKDGFDQRLAEVLA